MEGTRKHPGKTTYLSKFIKNTPDYDSDIIDINIIKKSIRIKTNYDRNIFMLHQVILKNSSSLKLVYC